MRNSNLLLPIITVTNKASSGKPQNLQPTTPETMIQRKSTMAGFR